MKLSCRKMPSYAKNLLNEYIFTAQLLGGVGDKNKFCLPLPKGQSLFLKEC